MKDKDTQLLEEAYETLMNIDGVPYETIRYEGKSIKVVNVADISDTGSYENDSNYIKHWIQDHNAYFFSAPKDDSGYFPLIQGIINTVKNGKNIIVFENLS